MPLNALLSWLGVTPAETQEHPPLRELIDALDRLEPDRARHIARFAYLLGRIAHADRHISADETRAMETLVMREGQLSAEQAMLVVSLAKSSNALFGGTADFQVAQEFAETARYEEKLALARCLFAVASSDHSISMAEETEIHRVLTQLKLEPADLTRLRVEHRAYLPGVRPRD
jgi:uncharacterized tellurite resistance protein B-like protein